MYSKGLQSYRRTNVITADPGRLVRMCYEGAIDNLIIAKHRYVEKKFEDKCEALKKAEDIIDELLCSLDFEKGGAIARNLESLYRYMRKRLVYADLHCDLAAFDEVIGMLRELLSAWQSVFSKQDKTFSPVVAGYNKDQNHQASRAVAL